MTKQQGKNQTRVCVCVCVCLLEYTFQLSLLYYYHVPESTESQGARNTVRVGQYILRLGNKKCGSMGGYFYILFLLHFYTIAVRNVQ